VLPGPALTTLALWVWAERYKTDPAAYDKTAREWTRKYAMGHAERAMLPTCFVESNLASQADYEASLKLSDEQRVVMEQKALDAREPPVSY